MGCKHESCWQCMIVMNNLIMMNMMNINQVGAARMLADVAKPNKRGRLKQAPLTPTQQCGNKHESSQTNCTMLTTNIFALGGIFGCLDPILMDLSQNRGNSV